MKKVMAISLVLLLVLMSFSACSKNEDGEKTAEVGGEGYMTNNNICTQDEYEKTLFVNIVDAIACATRFCTRHERYAGFTVYTA